MHKVDSSSQVQSILQHGNAMFPDLIFQEKLKISIFWWNFLIFKIDKQFGFFQTWLGLSTPSVRGLRSMDSPWGHPCCLWWWPCHTQLCTLSWGTCQGDEWGLKSVLFPSYWAMGPGTELYALGKGQKIDIHSPSSTKVNKFAYGAPLPNSSQGGLQVSDGPAWGEKNQWLQFF